MAEVMVHALRGGMAESIHRGDLAVVDWKGNLLFAVGNPREKVTYIRSSSKPIQALTVVESGAAEHFGLEGPELAIMCASHGGEPGHVDTVRKILAKIGLDESALKCGTHLPSHKPTGEAMVRTGQTPTEIHCNCSGKHSGMLALAQYNGWDVGGYTEISHPVQQAMLSKMARFADMEIGDIAIGVDGCGVPVYGLSVYRMALAFARLANPTEMSEPEAKAANTITAAMMSNPFHVAGTGRICTDLMRAARGKVFSKSGAEGVYCAGVPELGIGIALKAEDGNGPRCSAPSIVESLRQLGVLDASMLLELSSHSNPVLHNHRKDVIGEVKAVFTLRKESPDRA